MTVAIASTRICSTPVVIRDRMLGKLQERLRVCSNALAKASFPIRCDDAVSSRIDCATVSLCMTIVCKSAVGGGGIDGEYGEFDDVLMVFSSFPVKWGYQVRSGDGGDAVGVDDCGKRLKFNVNK